MNFLLSILVLFLFGFILSGILWILYFNFANSKLFKFIMMKLFEKDDEFFAVYSNKKQADSRYLITCRANNLQINDEFYCRIKEKKFIVKEIIENKDHRGKFNDPKEAIKSFYKITAELKQ